MAYVNESQTRSIASEMVKIMNRRGNLRGAGLGGGWPDMLSATILDIKKSWLYGVDLDRPEISLDYEFEWKPDVVIGPRIDFCGDVDYNDGMVGVKIPFDIYHAAMSRAYKTALEISEYLSTIAKQEKHKGSFDKWHLDSTKL